MERLQRSLSERPTPLETKVDFIDEDGVIRRSSTVTGCMTMRGATVGEEEHLSTELDDDKPHSSAEVELSSVCLAPVTACSMSESEMDKPVPREERMRRRTQFQLQLRERKHSMLVEQNTRHQERLQLWHDASELDPAVETTSHNTARAPSPRSQTYVDEDGNVRRKSSAISFSAASNSPLATDEDSTGSDELALAGQGKSTLKSPPSPVSLILGQGKASPTAPRIPNTTKNALLETSNTRILSYQHFMSGNAGEAGSKAVDVDVEADAIYHVRLIHSWPPLSKSPPLDNDLVSSFYGLQLELRGKTKDPNDPQSPITLFNDGQSVSKSGEIRKATTALLHFGSYSAPSPAILAPLEAITGPFEVVVLGKMPTPTSMNEDVLAALQQMVPVQAENTLLEINGERIVLDSSSTGADVYRRLWCVTSRASLAAPYELTFRRHNLAQASAKIVPFARRKDVQDAQIAQLGRLAAQEAALSIEIRRKQLFLVQQLDFEREHYLVAYVSGPLQQLHTNIMGGGQWQAFEYGKTLWYFHAPSARLYAQHPLRSHPEARKLIEKVQQQVQQAVRRLQRKTRSHQRRRRLMAVIQAEMQRREDEKRKKQQRHEDAVRRIQLRIRARQRRKRFLAMIEAAKRRQEELQQEQQRAEERRREEQRAEENQQIERLKQERQRLQQELTELKTELQQLRLLKETKLPVQTETQTSARRDENAIEMMRREEQQRLQQRLETLELDLQSRKEIKPSNESETQTSSRSSENDVEQQRARRRVEELELQLRHRDTKEVAESVTQTSGRRGGSLREEGVDTGDDLEWQRYLTLLRVAVKKKKTSPKSRHTQTDQFDGEETLLASSMLRAPQHAVSFSPSSRKPSGEWKGFPSWQRGSSNSNSAYSSNSSSTTSLLTLKSSLGQFDELDAVSPPTRTFESFFAPDFNMSSDHPPPPLVEQPWRQDSTFLPLKSSRKMLEITPVHQPLPEYEDPIRPMKNSSSFMISPASSPTNATKLPYITRRRKKNAS